MTVLWTGAGPAADCPFGRKAAGATRPAPLEPSRVGAVCARRRPSPAAMRGRLVGSRSSTVAMRPILERCTARRRSRAQPRRLHHDAGHWRPAGRRFPGRKSPLRGLWARAPVVLGVAAARPRARARLLPRVLDDGADRAHLDCGPALGPAAPFGGIQSLEDLVELRVELCALSFAVFVGGDDPLRCGGRDDGDEPDAHSITTTASTRPVSVRG